MAKKEAKRAPADNLVEITPPRVSGDANCFIGVNGVNYLIPRGKKSMVPPAVAEEFFRSQAAQDAMYEAQDAMKSK